MHLRDNTSQDMGSKTQTELKVKQQTPTDPNRHFTLAEPKIYATIIIHYYISTADEYQ